MSMGRISAAEQQYRLLKRLRERLKSRDSARIIYTRDLATRLKDANRRCGGWQFPDGDPPGWLPEMDPWDSSVAARLCAAKKRFSLWCAAGLGPKPVLPSTEQTEPPQSDNRGSS